MIRPMCIAQSLVACTLLLAAASGCPDSDLGAADADLWLEKEALDFGKVRIGLSKQEEVTVVNTGTASLVLEDLSTEGDEHAGWFQVSPRELEVAHGSVSSLTITFTPQDEAEVEAALRVGSNDPSAPSRTIALRGTGFVPDVTVSPTSLDFGAVVVDSRREEGVLLENLGERPARARIHSIEGDGASHFSAGAPAAEDDDIWIAPGASSTIVVGYAPLSAGAHYAGFVLEPCDGCGSVTISLSGVALDSGLVVTPASIDFGRARPEHSLSREISFENAGNVDIDIIDLSFSDPYHDVAPSPAYQLERDPLPLALGPGDRATVEVVFTPPDLEGHTVRLDWLSNDRRSPSGFVMITGRGGAPGIALQPEEIDFGKVALGFSLPGQLRIKNVGEEDLEIQEILIPEEEPFRVVEAGPDLIPPGEAGVVSLAFEPTEEGNAAASLIVRSSDPHNPEVSAVLLGEGVEIGPCTLSVEPELLQFGMVERGERHTGDVLLVNEGEGLEQCLISRVALADDAGGAYTLIRAPDDAVILDAGGTLTVSVELHATRREVLEGALEIHTNDADEPHRLVPLQAACDDLEIIFMPPSLEFGRVEMGCGSGERRVCVVNVGPRLLTLRDIQVEAFRGQGDFELSELPAGLVAPGVKLEPGARECFTARFHPLSHGIQLGRLEAVVDELTHPVLAPLQGTGANDGQQTDVIAQTARQKVDLLFVTSESQHRLALIDALHHLFSFAAARSLDYHIGVVDSFYADVLYNDHLSGGMLEPVNRIEPHIVTRDLADPLFALQENLSYHYPDSPTPHLRHAGFNVAERALHQSYLDEPSLNGGFLRDTAHLSVFFLQYWDERSCNFCGVPGALNHSHGCGTTDYYWRAFAGVKGYRRPELLSIHGAQLRDANQQWWNHYCEEPWRVPVLVERAGGHWFELSGTTHEMEPALQQMSHAFLGFKWRFELRNVPDQSTISVSILLEDGRRVAAAGWAYDPDDNAVVFDQDSVPGPGEKVEISYSALCVP